MQNFEFYNPVNILFGKGKIEKLSKVVPANTKIMLAYGGGSIKSNGVYTQVINALKGFDIVEFGGIEPNPHYETLMKAIEIVRSQNVGFILAVGGGSVIDGVKFIAAAATFTTTDPWDILSKRARISSAIPFGTVLTLPATGSEMNSGSVITRQSTQEKLAFGSPLLFPKFSVLDPEVVFSLPDKQVANGIVDAFIHVIEQYLTFPANAQIQDRFAESIMITLIEEGPKVIANRTDYDAAANFMWAATMALNGLIGSGVPQDWTTHLIGHELTAFYGIDHARTLAIILPGVMRVKLENKKAKILQFGERVWKITEGTDTEKVEATINRTTKFFESLGIKTKLADYGVGAEIIPTIKERFIARNMVAIGERGDLTPDDIEKILMLQSK